MMPTNRNDRRGFLIIDMLIGLTLLGTLATVLAIGVRSQQKGAAHLAESRAALRAAEAALIDLQSGANQPTPRRGVTVRVTDDPTTPASAGHRWVRIEAICNGRSATLYGLAGQAR